MGGESQRSFRIKGLRDGLTERAFLETIKQLNSELPGSYCYCQPHISLAAYENSDSAVSKQCGTVSCRSKYHQKLLIKKANRVDDWRLEPPLCSVTFEGMTILHAPSSPEMDICVLHGLNGHAIDTFERRMDSVPHVKARKPLRIWRDTTAYKIRKAYKILFRRGRGIEDLNLHEHAEEEVGRDSEVECPYTGEENNHLSTKKPWAMWPRDLLARHRIFKNSRIMTFDYNAKFDDAHSLSELPSWSDDLLRNMDLLRSKCSPDRPIIFIGYSMGGIVIRQESSQKGKNPLELCLYDVQAAADLWTRRSVGQYHNIPLERCGFMFMATPHYGSHLAETGKLANGVLSLSGRRKEMLGPLQGEQHNKCIKEHEDAWTDFFNDGKVGKRPIVCFSESRESKILHGLGHTVIVKRQNARWMDVNAEEIANTDHHTICTYSSANDNGYEIIVQRLDEIRRKLRRPEVHHRNDGPTAGAPSGPRGSEKALQQRDSVSVPLSKRHYLAARPPELSLDHCDSGTGINKSLTCSEKSSWHEEELDSLPQVQLVVDRASLSNGALGPRRSFSSTSAITIFQVQAHPDFKPWCLWETMPVLPGTETRNRSDMHISKHGGITHLVHSITDDIDTSLRDSVLQFSRPMSLQNEAVHVTEWPPPAGDANAWREQSSLSFDGGGLRGYSALLVLKMLMARVSEIEHEDDYVWREDLRPWKDEDPTISIIRGFSTHSSQFSDRVVNSMRRRSTSSSPDEKRYTEVYLPCHYFDYITGIGTGGIISIMLGRLRMSVERCIISYKSLAEKSFEIPHHTLSTNGLRALNRGNSLERAIKSTLPKSAYLEMKASPELCKTSVIAYEPYEKRCKVFRSYDNESAMEEAKPPPQFEPLNPDPADTCKVMEALRAVSAAPPHSRPIPILGNKYMDASSILANPSREGINEVLNRPGNKPSTLRCLVSIGCGQPDHEYYSSFQQLNSKNSLKAMALESQNAHKQTDIFSRLHNTPYFRFEVKGKTWKQSRTNFGDRSLYAQLEQEVNDYFDTKEAKQLLDDCAQNLVVRRRLRAQDQDRWSKFTGDL